MSDRLFDSLEVIKDELPPELQKFVDKLNAISENVNYMDANDYEEWAKDESKDGLEAYLREELSDYLPMDMEKYVVLWVNEDCDRNEDGEVIGGYEEGYYPTLDAAIAAAKESEKHILLFEAGREIVIVEHKDFARNSSKKPLTIEWTNQPERDVYCEYEENEDIRE